MARVQLLPPTSLEEVLGYLARLDSRQFEALRDDVVGSQAFNAEKDRCERLSEKLGLNKEPVAYLLSALSFLYGQVQGAVRDGLQFETATQALTDSLTLDAFSEDERQRLISRLPLLLAENPNVERAAKLRRLKRGFLSNAVGFSTFVDLRPNFSDDLSVEALIPIVQFRITTDAEADNDRFVVFQIGEDGLAELDSAVQRAKKKLAAIKDQLPIGGLIYHE